MHWKGKMGRGSWQARFIIEVCAEWWENVSGGFLQTPNQSLSQTWGLCLVPQYPAIWSTKIIVCTLILLDPISPAVGVGLCEHHQIPPNAGHIYQSESGWQSPCSRREQAGNYAKWPCDSGHRNLVISHPLCWKGDMHWAPPNKQRWLGWCSRSGRTRGRYGCRPTRRKARDRAGLVKGHTLGPWGRSQTWLCLTTKLDTVPKPCCHFLGVPSILAQCLKTFQALCVHVRFTLILVSYEMSSRLRWEAT